MSYLAGVIGRTWWQLVQLFAVSFALAVMLQWVGGKIRRNGVGWLGSAYWYLVSPGVACHETGHAVGCLLTGCKILKFVPFTRNDDSRLGYVRYSGKLGLRGYIASFVISSGPIWFGCIAITLLTRLFGGVVHVAQYREFFASNVVPGVWEYSCGMAGAAFGLVSALFWDGTWGWGFAVWLYLVFCIASEIGLSAVDIQYMWPGTAVIVLMFFLLNLIPPIGRCVSAGIFVILPWLFKCHVLMLAALALNLALCIGLRSVIHLFK